MTRDASPTSQPAEYPAQGPEVIAPPAPQHLRGVLLDVDGTLIDSNDAHAHAWIAALREEGIDVAFERVRPLIGMGGDKVLPAISGIEAESARGKAIGKRRMHIFRERYLPQLRPFPGTRALLERLRTQRLRLYIATSAQPDELSPLLRQAGVEDLIADAATAGDSDESKPDPDIVHAALNRAGLSADRVVLIGDTPYDIEAAARAGVAAIAFRCGGWNENDLSGACAAYEDPADLLRHFDSSPFARR